MRPATNALGLLGFERVALQPNESKRVSMEADPRLLARFDGSAGQWRIAAGRYRIAVGRSAGDLTLGGDVQLNVWILTSVGETAGACIWVSG